MDDLETTIACIRQQARRLRAVESFKTAFPELLFLAQQLRGFPGAAELARRMTDTLSVFLDETGAPRPTPAQLSDSILVLSNELERRVA